MHMQRTIDQNIVDIKVALKHLLLLLLYVIISWFLLHNYFFLQILINLRQNFPPSLMREILHLLPGIFVQYAVIQTQLVDKILEHLRTE